MAIVGKVFWAAVLACALSVALWLAPALTSTPPSTAPAATWVDSVPPRTLAPRPRVVARLVEISRTPRDASVAVQHARRLKARTTVVNYPPPPIQARAAILVDLHTGRVLFEKNADERLPMASTTKITTAALALQRSRLADLVRVSRRAATVGESTMALTENERVTVRQLLYGLLLNSGNDAAIALAEHVAGTVERFVQEMNAVAWTLGMRNTHYATPHGLDAANHYSSARDLATIARYAMRDPEFRHIVSTASYHIRHTKHNAEHWLASVNKVMYWYPGIDGIKPGDTDRAGLCQVVSVSRGGRHLVAVLLNTPTLIFDIRNLLNFGLHDFRWVQAPAYWDSPADAVAGGSRDSGWLYYYGSGHYIRGAFLHYFQTHGGLQTMGYPRTDALLQDGQWVQYFQGGELAYDSAHRSAYPVDLGLVDATRLHSESLHSVRRARVSALFAHAYKQFGGAGVLGLPVTNLRSRIGAPVQFFQYGELAMSGGVPMLVPVGDMQLRRTGWLPVAGAADTFPWTMASTFETYVFRSYTHPVRHLSRYKHRRKIPASRRKHGVSTT